MTPGRPRNRREQARATRPKSRPEAQLPSRSVRLRRTSGCPSHCWMPNSSVNAATHPSASRQSRRLIIVSELPWIISSSAFAMRARTAGSSADARYASRIASKCDPSVSMSASHCVWSAADPCGVQLRHQRANRRTAFLEHRPHGGPASPESETVRYPARFRPAPARLCERARRTPHRACGRRPAASRPRPSTAGMDSCRRTVHPATRRTTRAASAGWCRAAPDPDGRATPARRRTAPASRCRFVLGVVRVRDADQCVLAIDAAEHELRRRRQRHCRFALAACADRAPSASPSWGSSPARARSRRRAPRRASRA